MNVEDSLPACGQGAVGVETRLDDNWVRELLAPLHDADSAAKVMAERAMNTHLQGGCQVPIAGYAITDDSRDDHLWLRALVGDPMAAAYCAQN